MSDPAWTLANAPMRRGQIVVVALCIALNMLDGFDVLSISFAAPGIAAEWHVDKASLGTLLSMELLGMAAGSVLIGNAADRFGRRAIILGCLLVMALGMGGAAVAPGILSLSLARVGTGIGIGGMLSATSAMVAEFANDRRRPLAVTLNIAGFSAGAILGGIVVSAMQESLSWRSVFVFGTGATLVALPCAFALLPESPAYLLARRPGNALARINATLRRIGSPPLATLPHANALRMKPSIGALFAPVYRSATLLLTPAYFAQILLFYYVQKWVPKIVVDMGFDTASAGRVLVGANVGNLAGALAIALASQRWPVRPLVIAAMLAGVGAIAVFGLGFRSLPLLSVTVAVAAFFINAGVVGLYPVIAATFPAELRAGGTGFVIGVGRGGSALGPIVAGALFASGHALLTVSLVMGLGGVIAAAMVALLPRVPPAGAGETGS